MKVELNARGRKTASHIAKGGSIPTSSTSSSRELLNIQLATALFVPSPSWRATSSTEARSALESRSLFGGPLSASGDAVAVEARRGRGTGAARRGNEKLGSIWEEWTK